MARRTKGYDSQVSTAINQLSAYDGKARLKVEEIIRKSTLAIRRGASQRAARRSGELKRSIKTRFSRTNLQGQVYTQLRYAHLIELGTKAHTIKPKTKNTAKPKKAMRFTDGAKTVFAKRAYVKGITAKPFLRPAYDYIAPDIVKQITKAVSKP